MMRISIDEMMRMAMGRPIQPVQTKLYVAYGSNLNVQQMSVRCPDAEVEGPARLDGYKLMFQGRPGGAVATVIPAQGSHVPVLIWRITPEDEFALDRYEAWPTLYRKETVTVRHRGRPVEAMVYIMNEGRPYGQPGQGYLNTIREGYRAARFDFNILRKAVNDSARLGFR